MAGEAGVVEACAGRVDQRAELGGRNGQHQQGVEHRLGQQQDRPARGRVLHQRGEQLRRARQRQRRVARRLRQRGIGRPGVGARRAVGVQQRDVQAAAGMQRRHRRFRPAGPCLRRDAAERGPAGGDQAVGAVQQVVGVGMRAIRQPSALLPDLQHADRGRQPEHRQHEDKREQAEQVPQGARPRSRHQPPSWNRFAALGLSMRSVQRYGAHDVERMRAIGASSKRPAALPDVMFAFRARPGREGE
jgi:hypothetical protein